MLDDIQELRASITAQDEFEDVDTYSWSEEDDGTGVLLGGNMPLSYPEILAKFLPARQEVDRLVASYFRSKAIAAAHIHTGQFRRLYQSFWVDPLTVSPLWTSILFSILDIAKRTLTRQAVGAKSDTGESMLDSRLAYASASCLAIGEYYKPKPFSVEALLLYAQRKSLTSYDVSQDLAVIFGLLVRCATAQGYHRDPSFSNKNFSPFDGEMRRRAWSLCMQMDLLISFQLGLPSNVQYPTWDTALPTNLLDSDFDEDTLELPPARPETEHTEQLFYIAKHRIMAIFEKVLRHVLSNFDGPVGELEAIDAELRRTYAALPAVYMPMTMTESVTDSPSLIVTRLCVDFLYQKCLCVLHRKHVIHGRIASIRSCHESSSDIVRRYLDCQKEFEPGGQLETEGWFMGSITWHDFLLGCVALSLTICSIEFTPAATVSSPPLFDLAESVKLIKRAQIICEEQSFKGGDTRKVRRVLEAVVMKFGADQSTTVSSTLPPQDYDFGMGADEYSETRTSAPTSDAWTQAENMRLTVEEAEWAYLGQFLDLSNEGEHFT
ncbi:MAG: hypothetical protein M1820_004004 [Bogoriella megaspora]|nr:MAG: hypothetical protein M1820_004004 [Bogoriella megaspora]